MASRGLDFPKVSYVINYDLPTNIEDYVHRIGRTGRCGNSGISISFINQINRPIVKNLYQFMTENNQEIPEWFEKMYRSGGSGMNNDRFLQNKRAGEPYRPFFNFARLDMNSMPNQNVGFTNTINTAPQDYQPKPFVREEKKEDFSNFQFYQDRHNQDKNDSNRLSNFDRPRSDYRDDRHRDVDRFRSNDNHDHSRDNRNISRSYDRPKEERSRDDSKGSDRYHRHSDRSYNDRRRDGSRYRDQSRRDSRDRRDDRRDDSKDRRDHSRRDSRDRRDDRHRDSRYDRDNRRYDDRSRKEEKNDWRSGYFSSKYPDSDRMKKPRYDN